MGEAKSREKLGLLDFEPDQDWRARFTGSSNLWVSQNGLDYEQIRNSVTVSYVSIPDIILDIVPNVKLIESFRVDTYYNQISKILDRDPDEEEYIFTKYMDDLTFYDIGIAYPQHYEKEFFCFVEVRKKTYSDVLRKMAHKNLEYTLNIVKEEYLKSITEF